MAAQMTKRERVERTMARQETDRVALYDILVNDAAFEYFSGEKLPPLPAPEDDDHLDVFFNVAEEPPQLTELRQTLNRIVGKAVDSFLDMTRSVGFGPIVEADHTDKHGFVFHQSPQEKTSWIVSRPFSDEAGAIEFLKGLTATTRQGVKDVLANPGKVRENHHKQYLDVQATIGDTVNLFAQQGVGLDDARHLLGMELFAYVEMDEPGVISEFLEAYTDLNVATCHAIADVSLSPAVLTYGDIACKGRLLHSPDYLRREFYPRLKRINDAWHEHGFKCLFHSDGYLMDAMDDLVAAGIDGLNPIETVAGMDLAEVKQKYGDKLFLTGAIDMSQLLSRATPEEVKEICRAAIRVGYPGYFIGSTTESDNSVQLANLIAMHEVVMEGLPR